MKTVKTDASVEALRQLIDKESIDKLKREPGTIYHRLSKNKSVGSYTARMIYMAMLADPIWFIEKNSSEPSKLTEYIYRECGFRKAEAEKIADIFSQVFSQEHIAEWDSKKGEGFRELCSGELQIHVENENSAWHHGGVHVDCSFEAFVTFRIKEQRTARKALAGIIDTDPYVSSQKLTEYLEKQLQDELDADFEDYCTEDDYYPPVPEDYDDNFKEYVLKPFCEKYGLKCIDYSGQGDGADSYIRNDPWDYR